MESVRCPVIFIATAWGTPAEIMLREAVRSLPRQKHTLPVLEVAPDGPQNQIESNTAIEAANVEADAYITNK
jgi:hypothetical protein